MVAYELAHCRISYGWQCPSMATVPCKTPTEPSNSVAWRTCVHISSGTSANKPIIILKWRTAATLPREVAATVSTVSLQYTAKCSPRTLQLTDTVGSISWSHTLVPTNSPKISRAFPNCLDMSTGMAFTDSHQDVSLWFVNFSSSSCRFQCLFSRCREQHSAHCPSNDFALVGKNMADA